MNPHPTHDHGFFDGSMSTCREVIDFLMAYVDNELPPPQRAAFEQHLSICPSCVNYLDGYRATIALAKAAGGGAEQADVPPALLGAIRAARKMD